MFQNPRYCPLEPTAGSGTIHTTISRSSGTIPQSLQLTVLLIEGFLEFVSETALETVLDTVTVVLEIVLLTRTTRRQYPLDVCLLDIINYSVLRHISTHEVHTGHSCCVAAIEHRGNA